MKKARKRLATTAAILSSCLLLLPASGQAAQIFGSRLKGAPSEETPNTGQCTGTLGGPCTIVAYIHPTDPKGDEYSGGAPSDGVITKFRIRAIADQPTQVTFRLGRLANVTPNPMGEDSATATAAGTGPTVTVQPTPPDEAPIQEFAGRLPTKKGDYLAIDASDAIAAQDSNGSEYSFMFLPTLVDGRGAQGSSKVTGELLVQATLEPDADGDGFGDETQDQCPSQNTTQGACDHTKPAVTKFHVRKGKISYSLSEASTVRLQLAKKKGHGFKPLGRAFSGPGKQGLNHRGLPHARRLGAGVYRLTLTATDVAGNTMVKKTVFLIKLKSILQAQR
jgi:hypothetical protein